MAGLRIGATVADHFVVEALLGAGGMGAVYRVRDVRTGDPRAIKVLRDPKGDLGPRFIREARIAAALDHPNIARALEVLPLEDGSPAIVMELLTGESLGARLGRRRMFDAGEIARIVRDVVAGVRAAHARGVIHRDLKPDNVFLCEDGTVKVLDFGIAKVAQGAHDPAVTASSLTETGQILGTPQYMAPEQIFGEKELDGRVDIWALGVILYETCAGVRPFEGDNAGQVFKAIALKPPAPLAERAPHVPAALAGLVSQMLVHARAERLADLGEVDRVLATIAQDDVGAAVTLPAHSAPTELAAAVPDIPTKPRRAKTVWLVAGALVLAASGATTVAATGRGAGIAEAPPAAPPIPTVPTVVGSAVASSVAIAPEDAGATAEPAAPRASTPPTRTNGSRRQATPAVAPRAQTPKRPEPASVPVNNAPIIE